MSTLLIRSPSAMSAPPADAPFIFESDPSLLIDLDASRISGIANATAVSDITARGNGNAAQRRFNKKVGATWNFPLFSAAGGPDGGAALQFDGYEQIGNVEGTSDSSLAEIAQPTTHLVIAKISDYASSASARIVGGLNTGNLNNILPASANPGVVQFSAGTSQNVNLPNNFTGWHFLAGVFNGAASKAKVDGGAPQTFNFGPDKWRGTRLGGNSSILSSAAGFKGLIRRYMMFNRALSDDELGFWYSFFSQRYGV